MTEPKRPETLEEFAQREWDKRCEKMKLKKPYPPIDEKSRDYTFALANFVREETLKDVIRTLSSEVRNRNLTTAEGVAKAVPWKRSLAEHPLMMKLYALAQQLSGRGDFSIDFLGVPDSFWRISLAGMFGDGSSPETALRALLEKENK